MHIYIYIYIYIHTYIHMCYMRVPSAGLRKRGARRGGGLRAQPAAMTIYAYIYKANWFTCITNEIETTDIRR